MEYTSTGRPIQKDKTSYHRRQSARNRFPGIRALEKMPTEYIELHWTGVRRFVADKETPGALLCYCPAGGELPLEGDSVSLLRESGMQMRGRDIYTDQRLIREVSILMTSPDFKVVRLVLK